ncbi:maleylpyruvate isomerase N-terminal domain-containing protein [Streptomyces oceani]|uniref:Mycothiol-dependent maleylpyruvate isomerase metal-binding domain-containing protein n=1 Tax=Streptomyces oceani TaxID=1075402 RepID=A0A1E7KFP6_9ACTN|nr:maleylpyruvate isomerase N-terminal domain-containing protein [Streptomyces oceani]OEV02738.1 hypothetical protein AN216_14835 [Streptomyces oceani]
MDHPSEAPPYPAGPVTSEDLRQALHLALTALRSAPTDPSRWDSDAGSLTWTCWETTEHLCDDLLGYALQLGAVSKPEDSYVSLAGSSRRDGGPEEAVHADRAAGGVPGLLWLLEGSGALLVAIAGATPPHIRAFHSMGVSDAEGFAAMGIVETLVHTHDLALGLEFDWSPPADLCARVLTRLFPDVSYDEAEPWPTLLWATGRISLPGHGHRENWRWYGEPRA